MDRVPVEGGGVIAANHLSAIDPPLVGMLCPRTIYFMTKAELLATPIVGDFLSWTGAFSVRRGEGDRESLREARRLVARSHGALAQRPRLSGGCRHRRSQRVVALAPGRG